MKLSINREFLLRHLGVCLLMFGLAGWFGYDGFVTYPQTEAAKLYEAIERSAPPEGCNLEAFKRQKIQTQYGFAALSLVAALAIGLHLLLVARLRLEYDDTGFSWNGKKHAFAEISAVDRSEWGKGKKGVLILTVGGQKLKLDAWHHAGVAEFAERI